MRRSERLPAKRLPPIAVRSPFQPTRSVEEEAGGSEMAAADARKSAPSRKSESASGEADGT